MPWYAGKILHSLFTDGGGLHILEEEDALWGQCMRKRTLQDKIGQMVMEKPGMNQKLLSIKKSLDEMNQILLKNDGKKKG